MKKIKVSEASGPVLDWLVATAEGHRISLSRNWYSAQDEESFSMKMSWKRDDAPDSVHWWAGQRYSPSTDWSQGGPIIERERIDCDYKFYPEGWECRNGRNAFARGPTPLIAAMRCFCTAKLGDHVDVPEELCQQQSS